jgi:hypothetical protein
VEIAKVDIAKLSRKHLEDAVSLGYITLENQEVRQVTTSTILQLAKSIVKDGLELGEAEESLPLQFPEEFYQTPYKVVEVTEEQYEALAEEHTESDGLFEILSRHHIEMDEEGSAKLVRNEEIQLDLDISRLPTPEETLGGFRKQDEIIRKSREIWTKNNQLVSDDLGYTSQDKSDENPPRLEEEDRDNTLRTRPQWKGEGELERFWEQ